MSVSYAKFLFTCCCVSLLFLFNGWAPKARTMPEYQDSLDIISSLESYKNTTLLDTSQQLVDLQAYLTPFYTDFKYATTTNFTRKVLYEQPKAYLRLPAARALQNVIDQLVSRGLTLKIYDAYRPYSVTKQMWNYVPDPRYAADPAKGSGHNRGAAVDVTLVMLKSGEELEMPTAFDDFTEKAHHGYMNLPKTALTNRAVLRSVMEKAGFVALETEWWHYALPKAANKFKLMDLSFRQLDSLPRKQPTPTPKGAFSHPS